MKAKLLDLLFSGDGKQRLTVELDGDFRESFDELHGAPVEIQVKKFREKRSLDANAYAWVLIDKIAERMKLPKKEVYQDHIKTIGGVSETVCVQDRAIDRLIEAWEKHGIGWCAYIFPSSIPNCHCVTLYYGSSTYDSRQMGALIDSLIQSCKILNIETIPPDKLESMLRSYEK